MSKINSIFNIKQDFFTKTANEKRTVEPALGKYKNGR
jgi:hypothetical protein